VVRPHGLSTHLFAFAIRLGLYAGVLMLAIGAAAPKHKKNTLGRALGVSFVLSLAAIVTLARFFLLFWPLYALVWIIVIVSVYELPLLRAVLVALLLAALGYIVALVFGLATLSPLG
jgi:hypothetical protein